MSGVLDELRRESFQEGKAVGLAESRAEGKKSMVEKMLADGSVPLEKIAKFVDWSLDDVKRLQMARNG